MQIDDKNGGSANVVCVDLGHADNVTISAAIDKGVKFSDLIEVACLNADGSCADGFAASNADGNMAC